jgi:hypothetical protein
MALSKEIETQRWLLDAAEIRWSGWLRINESSLEFSQSAASWVNYIE